MPRARSRCSRTDCDQYAPCPDHVTPAWSGSSRRTTLPPDWEARRKATRDRAHGRCEGISLNGEPHWHAPTCNGTGTDCDHDKRGNDHSLTNLRWLSKPCHTRKTAHERT